MALSPAQLGAPGIGELPIPPEISRPASGDAHTTEPNTAPGEVQLSGTSTVTASKPRFVTTTSIAPRSGKSSGARLGSASKGYTVWGTGKTSSGHTQIKFFGKNAWVKSKQLKRIAIANYTTTRGTKMRSQAAAGKSIATLPTDYTVGTLTNAKKNKWTQVQYRGQTGWVASKDLKGVSLKAAAGAGKKSYSDSAWSKKIRQNISRYCPSIPVRVSKTKGEYYAESIPRSITLSRVGNNDPDAANIKAVALHECAHILQFTVYPSGFAKLTSFAERINPRRDGRGIEHLADCMSDKMGAKRTGTLPNGNTYIAGYKGKCTSAQNQAASALLAGKRPAGV
ncbi:SH3 domain-containing protein [Paeniglutamicibacter sp. R2-26]|uniref:SH3 domain-containing protein n=1 Tax=Paeniglutamicibacter sp. R2-26 TaxID=3144417 RepID=UPI003EE52A8C